MGTKYLTFVQASRDAFDKSTQKDHPNWWSGWFILELACYWSSRVSFWVNESETPKQKHRLHGRGLKLSKIYRDRLKANQ